MAEDIGLRIMAVTSDMGSSNQAMWNAFGICSSRAMLVGILNISYTEAKL